MDLNERIARALWTVNNEVAWIRPDRTYRPVPDYARSLDACLPVLAGLREKGWFWAIDQFYRGNYVAMMGNWNNTDAHFEATADDPAAALAEYRKIRPVGARSAILGEKGQ